MTDQEMVKVARDLVDAFNASDWDRYTKLLPSDSVYNELGTQRQLRGLSQIIEAMKGWKQAMPDVKGTVTNAFASGKKVTLEVTWEGTHTGPLTGSTGTIPATGKRQVTPSAWIFDFEGEKIKESRNYFDMLSFLQQIGAAPK